MRRHLPVIATVLAVITAVIFLIPGQPARSSVAAVAVRPAAIAQFTPDTTYAPGPPPAWRDSAVHAQQLIVMQEHAEHMQHLAHVAQERGVVVVTTGGPSRAPAVTTAYSTAPHAVTHASGLDARLLAEAETKAGDWYVWGGTGPDTFDCSGLVYWAAGQLGIANWPRTTYDLLSAGVAEGLLVRTYSPQPGNLAFYGTGHVEIYVRPGVTFGAHRSGTRISNTYYSSYWQPTAFYRVT